MIATGPLESISALTALPGRIAAVREGEGAEALVEIDCGGDIIVARVTRLSARSLGLAPGLPVRAVVKSVTFDRAGGA
jgi:molybdate transport system ATP-binding protein